MKIKYVDVNPTLIENTIMQLMIDVDDADRILSYKITPVNGYVLHDKVGDWKDHDEITGEEVTKQAFYTGMCTCGANYDFAENPREFFAISKKDFEKKILKKEKGDVF